MKKRNVIRGVLAAIISHYVVLFGLILLLWLLRPFVWAAIYGVPYQPVKGPMDPNSGEWFMSQAIGFFSWVAGGYAACRWDQNGSNRAAIAICLIYTVLAFVGIIPASLDIVRKLALLLEIPISISVGCLLFRYFTEKPTKALMACASNSEIEADTVG